MPSQDKRPKSFLTRSRRAVKRHSRTPGYHTRLPVLFPYFKNVSLEEALTLQGHLIMMISERDITGGERDLWHALTGHPKTMDGHVTLWLSPQAAEALITECFIMDVQEYEPDWAG